MIDIIIDHFCIFPRLTRFDLNDLPPLISNDVLVHVKAYQVGALKATSLIRFIKIDRFKFQVHAGDAFLNAMFACGVIGLCGCVP